jgi:organic radical activating enzyme
MSTNGFFCPAPWTSMYYHENTATPCHVNTEKQKMSPSEYLESDWLKKIKKDFKENRIPPSCMVCANKEARGLKSTRQTECRGKGKDPVKFPNEYVDPNAFSADEPSNIQRLELRSSNLCNFKCRMCNGDSSSEWKKETDNNTVLKHWSGTQFDHFTVTSEDNFEELKKMSLDNIRLVCFTGGEPLLIKHYYDFMDHIIDSGYNESVGLEFFTNCSVWNPLFIERMMKFKEVRIVMSIDGVGKVAEYNRKGTKWDVVRENIMKFAKLPKNILYNTAISPYNLLDFANLAKFLMEIYEVNPTLGTRCYSVTGPFALHFVNLNNDLRARVVEQIDQSLEILHPENFDVLKKELRAIKKHINDTVPERPQMFVGYTKTLDLIRDEKFEDIYNYKLY